MPEPFFENTGLTKEKIKSQIEEFKNSLKLFWTDQNYTSTDRHDEVDARTLGIFFQIYPEEKEKYNELKGRLTQASPEEILETQRIIRKKYGLPLVEQKVNDPNFDPLAYWQKLSEIAGQNGIKIQSKSNKTGMSNWGSYNSRTNEINASFNPDAPYRSARVLEHELVHAFQHQRFPRMTLCEQEFEAFVVGYSFHLDEKGKIEFILNKDRPNFTCSLLQDMILDFEEKYEV